MAKGKKGLGIVIIRIVVAALIVALIALILMMTVFKVPSTKKAYNALNDAFNPGGTISSMTNELDDFPEFSASYGKYVLVFKNELISLQATYPKLYYVEGVDDEQMNQVVDKLDQVKTSLTEATKVISDVNIGKKENEHLNVDAYVENLKPKILKALNNVIELNCSIHEFLTAHYYGGEYFETPFLNKLKTFVAKQYCIFAQKDYGSTESIAIYNFYKYLDENGFDSVDVVKANELSAILKTAKDINLFKLVDNITAYKKENSKDTDLTNKITQVENYINGISADFDLGIIANAKEAK